MYSDDTIENIESCPPGLSTQSAQSAHTRQSSDRVPPPGSGEVYHNITYTPKPSNLDLYMRPVTQKTTLGHKIKKLIFSYQIKDELFANMMVILLALCF